MHNIISSATIKNVLNIYEISLFNTISTIYLFGYLHNKRLTYISSWFVGDGNATLPLIFNLLANLFIETDAKVNEANAEILWKLLSVVTHVRSGMVHLEVTGLLVESKNIYV